jgi:hypothetical protein
MLEFDPLVRQKEDGNLNPTVVFRGGVFGR